MINIVTETHGITIRRGDLQAFCEWHGVREKPGELPLTFDEARDLAGELNALCDRFDKFRNTVRQ